MREIANLAELKALVDVTQADMATSCPTKAWVDVTQARIDKFADTTGDRQWIHVDPERCRRESPFGCTDAHGFLTLSLLSGMLGNALRMPDMKMGINYGLNKVRFPAPVPVCSRLRARITLLTVSDIEGGAQLEWGEHRARRQHQAGLRGRVRDAAISLNWAGEQGRRILHAGGSGKVPQGWSLACHRTLTSLVSKP